MTRIIFTINILLLSTLINAATWLTDTNTTYVFDLMVRDNDIYFSTWGGLGRLDNALGQDWSADMTQRLWTANDGLVSNDVRTATAIAQTGNIWVGSYDNGVSIIRDGSTQIINTGNGLPSNRVARIVDFGASILVGTEQGLSLFYYLEGVSFPLLLHQYNVQNTAGGLASNNIVDLLLSPKGYLFVATDISVSYVHVDSLDIDHAWRKWNSLNSPVIDGNPVKFATNETELCLAFGRTVLRRSLDPHSADWTTYSTAQGIIDHPISAVGIDASGIIWVAYGTWNENNLSYSRSTTTLLSRIALNGSILHIPENTRGLHSSVISRIVNHGSELFLASWGGGIYRRAGTRWRNYRSNCIGFPKISDIAVDKNHKIWFGSGNRGPGIVRKGTMGTSVLDGDQWQTFNVDNSPLTADNVLCLAVDSNNKKWFGPWDVSSLSPTSWMLGITIYDDETGDWQRFTRQGIQNWDTETQDWSSIIPDSPRLLGNTISDIALDKNNNVLVASYTDGVNIFGSSYALLTTFTIPNSPQQAIVYLYHSGDKYFIGTNNDRGLVIWNDDSLPVTGGAHWLIPPPPELNNCIVNEVTTLVTRWGERQHWIATSTGLFMWDETNWYKYDTDIKRRRFNNATWENDILYYVDEERLFGSVRTTPTALLLDPFNRLWIGSVGNGFSMYDPVSERFTNYYMSVSPLVSNYVTALAYDPLGGYLIIGTPDGVNRFEIGRSIKTAQTIQTVIAFPNPFSPERDGIIRINNFPDEHFPAHIKSCHIYNSAGDLVIKLGINEFGRFHWNGKNQNGKDASSGVYYYLISSSSSTTRGGKFALIR